MALQYVDFTEDEILALFTFTSIDEEDIESLMTIIRNEIAFDKRSKRGIVL